jgi:hypothetical protein
MRHSPLKIISHNPGVSKTTYVLLGNVPDEIKKAIKNPNVASSKKVLKDWYGANYCEKLFIKKGGSHYVGGEGPVEIELGDLGNIDLMKTIKDSIKVSKTDTSEGLASKSDLAKFKIPTVSKKDQAKLDKDQTKVDKKNEKLAKDKEAIEKKKEKGKKLTKVETEKMTQKDAEVKPQHIQAIITETVEYIYYPDIEVFLYDTIMDLKMKISKWLNIPIYMQHLWYYIGKNHTIPLKYKFLKGELNMMINSNIILSAEHKEVNDSQKYILGIPVDTNLYINRELIKVQAQDESDILYNVVPSTTEIHLVNIDDVLTSKKTGILELFKNDTYQFQLIYQGFVKKYFPMMEEDVFIQYLEKQNMSISYPILHPEDNYKFMEKQTEYISEIYDLHEAQPQRMTRIRDSLKISLKETTLVINSKHYRAIIHLRNLFDAFDLSVFNIPTIKLHIKYDNKIIVLNKTMSGSQNNPDEIPINTIYFKIIVSKDPFQKIDLYLYPDGSYHVKGYWKEELMYTFKDVSKIVDTHVSPIIQYINNRDKSIFFGSNDLLPTIKNSTIKFKDIYMTMLWNKNISKEDFVELENLMDLFHDAHIVKNKNKLGFVLEYFFQKGIYDIDTSRIEKNVSDIRNYYSYLTNLDIKKRWESLFENIRVFKILKRHGDIKFEIKGIRKQEYEFFMLFIVYTIHNLMDYRHKSEGKKKKKIDISTSKVGNLMSLKQTDPDLYNFKISDDDSLIVYSKLCQKPYQPRILSQEQYDQVSKKEKGDIVDYWNFSSEQPAYYTCPNPKYPHLRFITGKHPKKYCIPCCKISAPSKKKDDYKRMIHDSCLKDHEYTDSAGKSTSSRYIMKYGKYINLGRLCYLPISTMHPLFYDVEFLIQTPISTVDDDDDDDGEPEPKEKEKDADDEDGPIRSKFYLYGIQQNVESLKAIGVLFCLSVSLEIDWKEIIMMVSKHIIDNPLLFPLYLKGKIGDYYTSPKELTMGIHNTFISPKSGIVEPISEDSNNWNILMIELAQLYLEINVIVFKDVGNDNVELELPKYSGSVSDIINSDYNSIIILKHKKFPYKKWLYNPVYTIHKEVYFRAKLIDAKIYEYNHTIVQTIIKMINYHFNLYVKKISGVTLNIIRLFLQDSSKYSIKTYLSNKNNLCYGLIIQCTKSTPFYIPITNSFYRVNQESDISFDPNEMKNNIGNFNVILTFIKDWNAWVYTTSEKNGYVNQDVKPTAPIHERVESMYPIIKPHRWLLNYWSNRKVSPNKLQVIGFQSNNVYWYFKNSISRDMANKIDKKTEYLLVWHDPFIINSILYRESTKFISDTRTSKINSVLQSKYGYMLFKLQMIKTIEKFKAVNTRSELVKILTKINITSELSEINEKIKDIIYKKAGITLKAEGPLPEKLDEDISKIYDKIITTMHDEDFITNKSILVDSFSLDYYNFDHIILEKVKSGDSKDFKNYLKKLALTSAVQISESTPGSSKDFVFPNIINTCGELKGKKANNQPFCSKTGKLIVSKKNFDTHIDIFAAELKSNYSNILISGQILPVISYFKFIHRPNQLIDVTIL